MQQLIDKAKAIAPEDPGLSLVIASSLEADPAMADRAMRYFDAALEGASDMQRARFKLARLHHAQGAGEKALLHLTALLKAVPVGLVDSFSRGSTRTQSFSLRVIQARQRQFREGVSRISEIRCSPGQ